MNATETTEAKIWYCATCEEKHERGNGACSEDDTTPEVDSVTYDPADDKIRMRAASRLEPETYARVKAAGFGWAPRQGCFYAVWSPEREDLALELAGADEMGDEDTSLVERAEVRAERFDGYRENRKADAEGAHQAVAAIADNIPLGQPILVGHHSERHARRDAERIRSGMAKAVKMWKTAEYWRDRAASALRHATYKELPAVRARRIKTLEAELRTWERHIAKAKAQVAAWASPDLTMSGAIALANSGQLGIYRKFPLADYPRQPPASQYEGDMSIWSALTDGIINQVQAAAFVLAPARAALAPEFRTNRWVEHLQNRISYERTMLGEAGGLPADRFGMEAGGRIQRRGKWYPIVKVNRRSGQVISVTVVGHFATTVTLDEIDDYRAPAAGDAEKVSKILDKGPMCNYPGAGFKHMTAAEWKALNRYSDCKYTELHKATETTGKHRTKCRPMPGYTHACVFITDAKRVDPPAPAAAPAPVVEVETDAATLRAQLEASVKRTQRQAAREAEAAPYVAIEKALKAGVTVVSAPQLFPTPAPLAARMVEAANLEPGLCVLEPSAGTGVLVQAVIDAVDTEVLAYEINGALCSALASKFPGHKVQVRRADFLEVNEFQGQYPRILMNPPFTHKEDIKHILHALTFLAPGGRLVAICADGPGRREAFEPLIAERGGSYRPLPSGSFASEGTNVLTALVVINGAVA